MKKNMLNEEVNKMRSMMGLNEISESMEQKNIEQQTEDGTTKEDSKIVDSRSLNDMIEKYIKNKD